MVRPAGRRVSADLQRVGPIPQALAAPEQASKRPRPDAQPPDLGPAEGAKEDRRRRSAGECEHDRDATVGRLLLVPGLEAREDPPAAHRRMSRRVHREARRLLLAAQHHPQERVRGDAHDPSAHARDRHQAAGRVPHEPPVELVAREAPMPPGLPEQS